MYTENWPGLTRKFKKAEKIQNKDRSLQLKSKQALRVELVALFRRDNIIIKLLTDGKGAWSLQASEEQRMRNLRVWWNIWQHQSLKLNPWNVHSSAHENRSGRQGAVSCQMSNILMSQEKSPVFDLVSGAYGGWKAWPRSPPIPTSPGPRGPRGVSF